jgi:tetratricopeptide (TPR) repeat protein
VAKLRADFADVAAAVSPKPSAAGQTQPPPIPPEILENAKVLVARGNAEERALGMIALKQHAEADRIIQELKSKAGNAIDEAFRLWTMDGDNWYQANEPDKAIEPYEKAMALKPRDLQARQNLIGALVFARLGDVSTKRQRAIKIAEESLQLTPPGSTIWAMMQNNLGIAWSELPPGDKAENLKKAIAAYEAALTVYTKEAYPAAWARTQSNLGAAWSKFPKGNRAENLRKGIAAYEAALSVRAADLSPGLRRAVETGLSWDQLLTKDFVGALSTCERAANEDADYLPLQVVRAHALLFLGRTEEARPIYGKYVGQKIAKTGKSWRQTVLEQFDDLEKNGLKSPEFAKIREMLKSKMAEVDSAPAAK